MDNTLEKTHNSKKIIDITTFNTNNLEQCENCNGIGLIKYEPIKCNTCEGKKCTACNSKGVNKMPYDECDKCYGTGKKIY